MRPQLACALLLTLVVGAACGADTTDRRFDAVTMRAQAIADWLEVDASTNPLSTSEDVAACPEGLGVSASMEITGLARVELDDLEAFVAAQFEDVAEAAYHAGLGHPHGLAWVVFEDGSRLTLIDAYGSVNRLFITVYDCQSEA